jgi:hypothetical protein
VVLYELGLADRVIASALAQTIGPLNSKASIKEALRARREQLSPLLANYPAYFVQVFERIAR